MEDTVEHLPVVLFSCSTRRRMVYVSEGCWMMSSVSHLHQQVEVGCATVVSVPVAAQKLCGYVS